MQSGFGNIVFDNFTAHANSLLEKGINYELANELKTELYRTNYYLQNVHVNVQVYLDMLKSDDAKIVHYIEMNTYAQGDELGILRNQEQGNQTVPIYGYTFHDKFQKLSGDDKTCEPLLYPLLFPHGEDGWSRETNIKRGEYMKARLLQPEAELYMTGKNGNKLQTNRFDIMARLSQYWIIDGFSHMMDKQLNYQKNNQNYFMGAGYENAAANEGDNNDNQKENEKENDFEDNIQNQENNENDGEINNTFTSTKSFLSDSVQGSPRNRKKNASNALALVANLGKAHLFTTMTGNFFIKIL